MSRALPEPALSRLIVRSTSRTSFNCARRASNVALLSTNDATASCRRTIAWTLASGCVSQSRKRRAPIGVVVRLSAP